MRPRRGRNGNVVWSHQDVELGTGWPRRYRCRNCPKPAKAPNKFYCSAPCRTAFLESVPPYWPELAAKVRRRDNYTCQLCGSSRSAAVRLEVDHVKPVALHPELEFEITNLRTLCHDCHVRHGARPTSKAWLRLQGRIERPLTAFAPAARTGGAAGADARGHLTLTPPSGRKAAEQP